MDELAACVCGSKKPYRRCERIENAPWYGFTCYCGMMSRLTATEVSARTNWNEMQRALAAGAYEDPPPEEGWVRA